MPSLRNHQSNTFTKMLLEGDSGSGKTGALASLAGAGYKLRILDFDNGLDSLKSYIVKDFGEAALDNVEFRSLRDERKAGATGPIINGKPKAYIAALKMLDGWKYDDTDLGDPAEWGPDCILVIDSLTFLSDAAFDHYEPLAPKGDSGKYDVRAVYKAAQDGIESVLALLTAESFRTNVIVTSHIRYMERPDGTTKGYPTSVGSALSPVIPRYFNTVACCLTGPGGNRSIQTQATAMLDLKNTKPFAAQKSFEIKNGLAEFFKVLRESPSEATEAVKPSAPKTLTLKRA